MSTQRVERNQNPVEVLAAQKGTRVDQAAAPAEFANMLSSAEQSAQAQEKKSDNKDIANGKESAHNLSLNQRKKSENAEVEKVPTKEGKLDLRDDESIENADEKNDTPIISLLSDLINDPSFLTTQLAALAPSTQKTSEEPILDEDVSTDDSIEVDAILEVSDSETPKDTEETNLFTMNASLQTENTNLEKDKAVVLQMPKEAMQVSQDVTPKEVKLETSKLNLKPIKKINLEHPLQKEKDSDALFGTKSEDLKIDKTEFKLVDTFSILNRLTNQTSIKVDKQREDVSAINTNANTKNLNIEFQTKSQSQVATTTHTFNATTRGEPAITVSAEHIQMQVRESLKPIPKSGEREMDVHLDPPDLGKMQVRVIVEKGEVKLSFLVEHSFVRESIKQGMNELRHMLSQEGLSLGNVDVGQFNQPNQSPEEFSERLNQSQATQLLGTQTEEVASTEVRRVWRPNSLVDTLI